MAQTLEAIFHQGDQRRIDHTPSGAALVSGQIISKGGIAAVCTSPEGIADGALGAVDVDGTYKIKKGAVVFSEGDVVGWDDTNNTAVVDGDPNNDFDLGMATQDAASGDDYVLCWLNKQSIN